MRKGFSASYFTTFLEFLASTTFIWVFSKLNAKRKWIKSFPDIKYLNSCVFNVACP